MVQDKVRYDGPVMELVAKNPLPFKLLVFDEGICMVGGSTNLMTRQPEFEKNLNKIYNMDYEKVINGKFGLMSTIQFTKWKKIKKIELVWKKVMNAERLAFRIDKGMGSPYFVSAEGSEYIEPLLTILSQYPVKLEVDL